jgi:hypothetical protein
LLTDANSLQREIHETGDSDVQPADRVQEKCGKPGEGIAAASKEPDVGPGIEFVLASQQANFRGETAVAKLCAIGVLLPAHAAEKSAIPQAKGDQITAPAMIWPENKFSRLQFSKGIFDIDRAKTGAVSADNDDFVVAQLVSFLDRIFQPRREVVSDLPVDARFAEGRTTARSKKMNIDPARKHRAEGGKIQKRAGRIWETPACQLDVCFFGKN